MKSKKFQKIIFNNWLKMNLTIKIYLVLFALIVFVDSPNWSMNKLNDGNYLQTQIEKPPRFALFDVDCLYWNDETQSLQCKARVKPIEVDVYKIHAWAKEKNIPVLFTTCCSWNFPQQNELDSIGMLYVPLSNTDTIWKNMVNKTTNYYIAKSAYGCPKMNYDRNTMDMFLHNKNLKAFLNQLEIKEWYLFGDGFETCVVAAMDGLLQQGYSVTLIEDLLSSGHSGNIQQRDSIINIYKTKGVKLITLNEFMTKN